MPLDIALVLLLFSFVNIELSSMHQIELLGESLDLNELQVDGPCDRQQFRRRQVCGNDQSEFLDLQQFEKSMPRAEIAQGGFNLACFFPSSGGGDPSVHLNISRQEPINQIQIESEEDDQPQTRFSQRVQMLTDPEKPCLEVPVFDYSDEEQMQAQIRVTSTAQITHHTPTKSNSTEISVETGGITAFTDQTRKDKLKRYLQKRSRRNWNRKVYYDCRKKVADSRLRIKGRFITRDQAEDLLGEPMQGYSLEQVKSMLQNHMAIHRKTSADLNAVLKNTDKGRKSQPLTNLCVSMEIMQEAKMDEEDEQIRGYLPDPENAMLSS